MTTKTKLIILAVILVGVPLMDTILAINDTHFRYWYYVPSSIFSPFAMVFFGGLFAMYFMRLKTGRLVTIRLLLKWGIYSSIVIITLIALVGVYRYLPYVNFMYRSLELQVAHPGTVDELKHFLQSTYMSISPALIYIALMYLSLRINKSVEKDLTKGVNI